MTKVKTEHVYIMEGCKSSTTDRKTLQKHYQISHCIKEQLESSLTIRGIEYIKK